jgi:signal transduction histidine kinase
VSVSSIVTGLQLVSSACLVVIAALTIRDWFATRDRSRTYLALAIGSLAAVSALGQVGKLAGPSFTAVSSYLTIVLFMGSGLALLLFRDSVLPLRPLTRRLAIGIVGLTCLFMVGAQLIYGRSIPKPVQLAELIAFVVVWSGCVAEPSIRLWINARRRTAVQRARMRQLSYGYGAIIAILLAAVLTSAVATHPAVQVGLAISGLLIIPPLYAGFAPPAWLRRTWRQAEEANFQQAVHDIVMFSPDQKTLAKRALEWAIRLSGADSGYFVAGGDTVLAIQGISEEDVRQVQQVVTTVPGRSLYELGGRPPRSAIVSPLPGTDAVMVLLSGPFTPVFGVDAEGWLKQYTSLVSAGLERTQLSGALRQANQELEGKVRQVVDRTRQLEAANKELEAFSYTISHDLRAPLRAINGFTSILLEEYGANLTEEAVGYLKRVRDNGEHMGNLVDDLLRYSRLGRQALRTQPVKPRAIVDRVLEQLAPSMEGREIEVVIGSLPDCDSDPILLEQVYSNLLGNAIKYSRKREHARIELGALEPRNGDGPVYFVKDNGAGFDMAYSQKLFGVFQRLHRAQEFEGTGVGLAIVHRIVERHGGRIWADAKVNEGATFYFTLKGADEWQAQMAA